MDHNAFDRMAKALGGVTNRRSGLMAALGTALGGPFARSVAGASGPASPAHGPEAAGPCGPNASENKCKRDSQCCTGYCKPGKKGKAGRCRCAPKGHPCTNKSRCCHGLACTDGSCKRKSQRVPTGAACAAGAVCANPAASCVPYAGGSPAGTYCLLPAGAACAAATDCALAYCGGSGCAVRPAAWTYQSTFSDIETGGPFAVEATADGRTVYLGAYTTAGYITAWTRPSASGAGAASWSKQATIAGNGTAPGQVRMPFGLAFTEEAGTLVTTDTYTFEVSMWSGGGTTWTYQSRFATQPQTSGAAVLTRDGLSLYVANYNGYCVNIFTRPSTAATAWTQGVSFADAGPEMVNNPYGIALGPDELSLYVADGNNDRVSIWTRPSVASQTWTYVTSFGAAGSGPGQFSFGAAGLAVAGNGLTIWVADTGNDRVQIWTRPDTTAQVWTYLTSFGTAGAGDGELNDPIDVAISGGGQYVYVTDSKNNRVSVWLGA